MLPEPIWTPTKATLTESNAARWMAELGLATFADFHRWSVENRAEFWQQAVQKLGIPYRKPASEVLDISQGTARAAWFPDARLNIVDACFQAAAESAAIIVQPQHGPLRTVTYGELKAQTSRVANSLVDAGYKVGDAIAVVLPMTALSVPIYLGIIAAGCVVVSIADSFAPAEIASRLRIAGAKMVFTYDCQIRSGKKLPLYARVAESSDLPAVVLYAGDTLEVDLREQDRCWQEFLAPRDQFTPVEAFGQETINILFSSGTTGEPKAIPWNHLTPLKCAIDGYVHQDIQPGQACVWPTNLGWMMGPWLIFASLINRATIGLFEDVPRGAKFGRFIQDAGVNMLGVVPTLVKSWRSSGEMEAFDWSQIQVFSSTGESSNVEDMIYLSKLAGGRPIIEYCGGTEIGGGYVSSSLLEPNYPAAFNTPAIGLDFVLVDDEGQLSNEGEVFLIPPSIGLSQRLINRDHDAEYYQGVPEAAGIQKLRRHGDYFRRVEGGRYVAGGRADDTMNLGGIKISSVEIERVLNQTPGVRETAAVAISVDGGPTKLVVFVVADSESATAGESSLSQAANKSIDVGDSGKLIHSNRLIDVMSAMNAKLKQQLNPLFQIHEIKIVSALPRTISGKIVRRSLR